MIVALLERFRKERDVLKAAPWSFLIVFAACLAAMWTTFHYVYRDKLADCDRTANQWKSNADYWKDIAEHPKKEVGAIEPITPPPDKSIPARQAKQQKSSPVTLPNGATINAISNAPDSAAIGVNTGTVTVNPPLNPLSPQVYYDFGGGKHIIQGNHFVAEAGEQVAKFTEMANLEKEQKWDELQKVAQSQIDAVPIWLTPYLFAAEAHAAQGNKAKAIQLCEYVKTKSGGNKDFDGPADSLLNAIGKK